MWTIRGSICNIIRNCSDIYLKKLDSCDSGDRCFFFSWLFQYHYQLSAAQFSGRKHVNHAVLFAIGYRVVHEKWNLTVQPVRKMIARFLWYPVATLYKLNDGVWKNHRVDET